MKKIFIALSVIAAATFGVNAQNPSAKTVCPQAPCCNVKAGDKARCTAPNPFEGLNLTEQQQKKIDELRQATRQQKLANDSIRKANRDQKMRDFKNKRSEYLKSVKAILTPEQYVQYLENSYINAPGPRHGGKDKHFGKRGDRKHGHKHGNGQKGANRK